MTINSRLPIVLLISANDRINPDKHLRNLSEEINRIRDALQAAERAGLCDVLVESNASVDRIFSVFQDPRYRDRIAILHYAGHANSYHLLLESASGGHVVAYAEGLAAFLGQQRALELVFLNGCSIEQHVELLLQANCAAVIATSEAIDDQVAMELASRFYEGLGGGANLERAYKEAIAGIKTQKENNMRALYWSGSSADGASPNRSPWELSVRPGSESARDWNIPDAAGSPLFGLPSLPKLDLPESPFRHLDWFAREHAEVFFGRGFQIRELFQAATSEDSAPIILFYGQSGVGKSSALDAGLLPRLETTHRVHYLRRDRELGLLRTLLAPFADPIAATKNVSLRDAWHQAESEEDRPVVVVLDQVEEVFTRPNPEQLDELNAFVAALDGVFRQPNRRPRGKLILGFRKEWLPEIDKCLREYKLPRNSIFLETLDRRGVLEAITGPTRSTRLLDFYKLKIEAGLAEEIAGDLLADRESPVAPTLQILVSKLWEHARESDVTQPTFTRDWYLSLKRDGILLGDFLDQQLKALEGLFPGVVQSGLALDVLAFHTTSTGAAAQRTTAELRERYAHQSRPVQIFVAQCKNKYVLSDLHSVQIAAVEGTRLAHDTLAPLVHQRFENSDRPGQRARRALENRAVDWSAGKTGPVLDAADLELVDAGASGMRVRTTDEKRLLVVSRKEVKQKKAEAEKHERALREARTAAETSERDREFALRQQEQAENIAESLRLASEARFASSVEPEAALLVAWEALLLNHNELTEDVFRETLDKAPAPVRRLCNFGDDWGFRMSAGYADEDRLVFVVLEGGKVSLLDLSGTAIEFTVPGSGKLSGCCAGKRGDRLLAVRDRFVRLYDLQGVLLAELDLNPTKPLSDQVLACDGNNTFLIASDGYGWLVHVDDVQSSLSLLRPLVFKRSITDLLKEKAVETYSDLPTEESQVSFSREYYTQPWHKERVYRYLISPSSSQVATVSFDGTARIWNMDGSLHCVLSDPEGHRIDSIRFLEGGKKVATGTMHYGDGYIWNSDGELQSKFKTGKGDGDDLFIIAVNPSGAIFATTNRLSHEITLWTSTGELLGILSGHTDHVRSTAFSADSRLLASGSNDRTVRVWDCETKRHLMTLQGHTGIVFEVQFATERQREIFSFSSDGTVCIWSLDAPLLPSMNSHRKGVDVMAHTSIGLLLSSDDSTTCLWHLDRKLAMLPGRILRNNGIDEKRSLTSVATVQEGHSIRTWRLPTAIAENPIQLSEVTHADESIVTISEDQSRLLIASTKNASIYLTSGEFLCQLTGTHDNRVEENYNQIKWAGFSPTGAAAFTAAVNGMVWLWTSDGEPIGSFIADNASPDRIFNVSLDPLGEFIAVCIRQSVGLWTWKGRLSHQLRPSSYKTWRADFSPDGGRIVTTADGPGGSVVEIWSRSGDRIGVLAYAAGTVGFDPNLRYLCLASSGGLRIYDLDGQAIGLLGAPLGVHVRCHAISPDGERVAASFSDGIVRIWGLSKKRRIASFAAGSANSVIFSSDGRRLLVATPAGPINQYALFIEDLFRAAAARVARPLTEDEIARYGLQLPLNLDIRAQRTPTVT